MKIHEFAERAGVTAKTLLYYDKIGLLTPLKSASTGYRIYREEDFIKLQQIITLKFVGLSLDEIKNVLCATEENLKDMISIQKEAFNTAYSETGFEGMRLIEEFKPNLIVLDVMLPDISGFDICKKVSMEYKIPIVMITAKTDIVDKIIGMELGADDYITKPFDIREAIVRIKAIFRRIEQAKESIEDKAVIELGDDIKIFKESRTVNYKNKTIVFTPKEYDLLLLLSEGKGKAFTREQILNEVWGFDFYGDTRTIDIHIQRIRKKLGMKSDKNCIKTIFGVGYRLD